MTTTQGLAVAAVVSSLSPGDVGKAFTADDRASAQTAHDWQKLGVSYIAAEVHGTTKGLPNGYAADLVGRAAAAGEQLGLAFAAVRDSEVWRDTSVDNSQASRRNIAGRAIAEASGLWAVSAGHATTNVVARVVRIHKLASGLDKKLNWSGFPAPFDAGRAANLSINRPTINAILNAAQRTNEGDLVDFVQPLSVLVNNAAWQAVTVRRDAGYHRLRPQSVDGGVPNQNPWVADNASGSLSMSVLTSSSYAPPVLEDVVAEARAGYDALNLAMGEILQALPKALSSVGVPIFKV